MLQTARGNAHYATEPFSCTLTLQLPEMDHFLTGRNPWMFVVVNLSLWAGFLIMFVLAWYEEDLEHVFA